MKTYIELQGRVINYNQHFETHCPTNENFATGIVKIAEKDPKGIWHNVYVNLRIFNPTEVIQENIDYTMVGSLGVYPACKQFQEKLVINVKTIERTQQIN